MFAPLPHGFAKNRGQTDGRVRYLARAIDHTLFPTADGAVLRLVRNTVRLQFHAGNRAPALKETRPTGGPANYLGAVAGAPHFSTGHDCYVVAGACHPA